MLQRIALGQGDPLEARGILGRSLQPFSNFASMYDKTQNVFLRKISILLFVSASVGFFRIAAIAQVTPDTTLAPSASSVDQNSSIRGAMVDGRPASLIEGGAQRDRNLFHSFLDFNVADAERVYFSNPADINNIFARVTGSNPSFILGTLGVDGPASLFLLNPNGMLFGENAQLDVKGSFLATTASSFDFDGSYFGVDSPEAAPLLAVSAPVGLQYGNPDSQIIVGGVGNEFFFDFNTGQTVEAFRPDGLRVPEGRTLAILGGEVTIDGGNLTSLGGNIEVAAVTSGYLPIGDGSGGYLDFETENGVPTVTLPSETQLGNVVATNSASINASGEPSGSIKLLANTIEFNEGAIAYLDSLGNADGGSLQAIAPQSFTLRGFSQFTGLSSSLTTRVPDGSLGDGADIAINTDSLQILNGGLFATTTDGDGDAGDINLRARDVRVAEINPFMIISVLASNAGAFGTGRGNGGNLTIDTERLTLADASATGVLARGSGSAGNVSITATDFVEMDTQLPDFVPFPLATRLSSEASPTLDRSGVVSGDAGNISIKTPNLRILNGSQLRTSNTGFGDGGNVSILADTVEIDGSGETLSGFSPSGPTTRAIPSQISASVSEPGIGRAGSIQVNAGQFLLSNGGRLASSVEGDGTGGEVVVEASDRIEISGANADGTFVSGVYSSATAGSGSGGSVFLRGPLLEISEGATVDVSNFDSSGALSAGTGPAGNINIDVDTVALLGSATLNANTLSGAQGNINLTARDLSLRDRSRISTNAEGAGSGGNLDISADRLNLLEGSELVANANGLGDAGDISIAAAERLALREGRISASGGQGDVSLRSPLIVLRDGSSIATDARGEAAGGNITLDTNFLLALENSDITANAEQSSGGRVSINARSIIGTDYRLGLTPESDITASSELGPELDGTVELNTLEVDLTQGLIELAANFSEASSEVAAACQDSASGNSLIASGRGGTPTDPTQMLGSSSVWTDFRQLEAAVGGSTAKRRAAEVAAQVEIEALDVSASDGELTEIVEAQSFEVKDGRTRLLAATSGTAIPASSLCVAAQ